MNTVTTEKLAKLKEKIALLLNKAENTPYPAEAQTFQEHAERMMVRYGITAAQLDVEAGRGSQKTEEIIETRFVFKGSFRKQEFAGFSQICNVWPGITLLKSTERNTVTAYVIGHKSDVESVLRMLTSLLIQLPVARTTWWKSVRDDYSWMSPSESYLERRTYTLGWMGAVASRFKELFREESAEAGTGTDLVLASRQDQVEAWRDEKYTNLRYSRSQLSTGSYNSRMAGSRDGQRADLGLGGKIDQARQNVLN